MDFASKSPKLSIVICTFNRSKLLQSAIKSVWEQEISPVCYELIIVDNGSTDNTKEVVEQSYPERKNIRYIFEVKQGLSHPRNRGWKEAYGEYVVYIDDESLLPPGYLETTFQIIQSFNPDIFGGVIKALYDFEKPLWVKEEYFSDFLGRKTGVLPQDEFVYGGNMGIKKDVLNKLGGFNINLGMKGNQLAYAEEVEFQQRATENIPNLEIYFNSSLWLYHKVREEKVKLGWLLRWYFLGGKKGLEGFNAIQDYESLPAPRKLIRVLQIIAGIFYGFIRICARIPILIFWRGKKYPYWEQYMVEKVFGIDVNKIGVYWGELEHVFISLWGKETYG